MSSGTLGTGGWTGRVWWSAVAVAFLVQVGLICWLGERELPPPRRASAAPSLRLVGPSATDWLTLSDPTLFALPHARAFSGAAWMQSPQPEFQTFVWSEPPRWLEFPVEPAGAALQPAAPNNQFDSLDALTQAQPELRWPALSQTELSPTNSRLRLAGPLAGRKLLRPLHLRSWPHTDLLTNSVVQTVVDAGGRTISVLLLASSGYKNADDLALQQARNARFAPLAGQTPDAMAGLACGEAIFEWHTLPVPPTNSPAAK